MELAAVEPRPLRRADLPLLSRRLAEPLVARWCDDDPAAAAVEARYGPGIDGTDPTDPTAVYLGVHGGEPFGLVQVHRFADEPESLAELGAVRPVPPGALTPDDPVDSRQHVVPRFVR